MIPTQKENRPQTNESGNLQNKATDSLTHLADMLSHKSLLGNFMAQSAGTVAEQCQQLEPDDFPDPKDAAAFELISACATSGVDPQIVNVQMMSREQGDISVSRAHQAAMYLFDLYEQRTIPQFNPMYLKSLKGDRVRRRMVEAGIRRLESADSASLEDLRQLERTEYEAVEQLFRLWGVVGNE